MTRNICIGLATAAWLIAAVGPALAGEVPCDGVALGYDGEAKKKTCLVEDNSSANLELETKVLDVSGQTFYLFTIENLKQFGSLKAMGVTNRRIIGMILLQGLVVGVVGFSIGMGLAALFFETMERAPNPALRGMFVHWQIVAIVATAVTGIVIASALTSVRRVLVLEPAVVFK